MWALKILGTALNPNPSRGRGAADGEWKALGKGEVSSLGITRYTLCTTPQSDLSYTLKHQDRATWLLFWVQTTTEIIIQLPQPVYSFSAEGESFDLPLQGKDRIYVIFLLCCSEFWKGQLVPTALSAEEASWAAWKQLDLWSVCLFYSIPSSSHCLKVTLLMQTPQKLHCWETHLSLLEERSPWNSCAGLPAPPSPPSAPSWIITLRVGNDLCQRSPGAEWHLQGVGAVGGRGTNPSAAPHCQGRRRCTPCARALQFLLWPRQRSCAAQSSSWAPCQRQQALSHLAAAQSLCRAAFTQLSQHWWLPHSLQGCSSARCSQRGCGVNEVWP